jgi:effector-binding domain-containing protein
MFKKVIYISVISIIIFVISGLLLPRNVHVERSVEIARPASEIFDLINGFSHFEAWSPWAGRDPTGEFSVSGPASGVGARIDWQGDPRLIGTGWQEIVESRPWSLVKMVTDIDQQGRADSYFHLVAIEGGTRIAWGFDTDLVEGQGFFGGILGRYFGLFFDRWIGYDQETGLARLKAYAESLPVRGGAGFEAEQLQAEPLDILYVTLTNEQAAGDLSSALAAAYREISAFMSEHAIEMGAQPMAITRSWNSGRFRFDAAIPVADTDIEPSGNVRLGKSPGGPAVRIVHRGTYDRMTSSYEKLAAYMAAHGLGEGEVSWEQYISDPGKTAPEERITHIYFLIDTENPKRMEQ